MTTAPRFASALSTHRNPEAAAREALENLDQDLAGHSASLVVAFATPHFDAIQDQLGPRLRAATGADVVAGCTGERVLASGREVEEGPGLALFAVAGGSKDLRLASFHVRARPQGEGRFAFEGLPQIADPAKSSLLVFADPFSFPASEFLRTLDERYPGLPAIGGMASGGTGPGTLRLMHEGGAYSEGALCIVLEGGLGLHPVVSQGCRPVGDPFVITKVDRNMLLKLGGKQAAYALHETLENLPEDEASLFRRGPFLGLAVDANKSQFERADFLVRGVLGLHRETGSIAISDDTIRPGMTVQFLVRDPESAGDDLTQLLQTEAGGALAEDALPNSAGALVFSCNGRGKRMFGEAHHDASRVENALGQPIPTAGFFAMGEIGPVGGRNFLHGFTASVAVLR
ncbi:MAG: FIST N-terminal domain-containing protein [Planctomycetota bacterium]